MEPKEILIRARKLIEDPEHWGQGAFLQDGKYCATGALIAVGDRAPGTPAYQALYNAIDYIGQVCSWNDTHTHTEVLAAFDRAIASFD